MRSFAKHISPGMVFTILPAPVAGEHLVRSRTKGPGDGAWVIVQVGVGASAADWRTVLCEDAFCLEVGSPMTGPVSGRTHLNIRCLFPSGLIGTVNVMFDDPVLINCGTEKV